MRRLTLVAIPPSYNEARNLASVLRDRRTGFWFLFDYASVRQALADHDHFSSCMAAAARTNPEWMIFLDPPRYGTLCALISKAFTPKAVADLRNRPARALPPIAGVRGEERSPSLEDFKCCVAEDIQPAPTQGFPRSANAP